MPRPLLPQRSNDQIRITSQLVVQTSESLGTPNSQKSSKRLPALFLRKVAIIICCSLSAIFCFHNVVNSKSQLRRVLCARKLQETRRNDDVGGSEFIDLVDRILQTVTSTEDECETVYPKEVAVTTAEDYYSPPEPDSGIYYSEEVSIPEPELAGFAEEEEVDPVLLNPDVDSPDYYTNVDAALLDVYEPKTYEPVNTTERPKDTTAYSVVITSCPETYNPPESEVTDPGTDIFEASAMLKQAVCNVTETAVYERRMKRRLRGLQDITTDSSIANYTM